MAVVGSRSLEQPLYVGVSTKMYLGYTASLEWLADVAQQVRARPALSDPAAVRVFIIPSFPVLESAHRILDGLPVVLGAQNCASAEGPFTGEVSAGMLAELGVGLVELGHAERRRDFGEDDAVVGQKVRETARAGIAPLLCVGEPSPRPPEQAAAFCLDQIRTAVGDDAAMPAGLMLAYEPVWAIGAARPAPEDQVNAVARLLRAQLGPDVPVVYGGSAGPGLLPRLPEVDGLFLGRFAHDPANLGLVLDEALAIRSGREH